MVSRNKVTPGGAIRHEAADDPITTVAKLRALAHPVRLRMVELIRQAGGGICVCQFENHFELTQPTITHHLKVLRDAGLVLSDRKGTWMHQYLNEEAFGHLEVAIGRFAAQAAEREDFCTAEEP
jgi:ArsR family transcriptional regulator